MRQSVRARKPNVEEVSNEILVPEPTVHSLLVSDGSESEGMSASSQVINSMLLPTMGEEIMLARIIDVEEEYEREARKFSKKKNNGKGKEVEASSSNADLESTLKGLEERIVKSMGEGFAGLKLQAETKLESMDTRLSRMEKIQRYSKTKARKMDKRLTSLESKGNQDMDFDQWGSMNYDREEAVEEEAVEEEEKKSVKEDAEKSEEKAEDENDEQECDEEKADHDEEKDDAENDEKEDDEEKVVDDEEIENSENEEQENVEGEEDSENEEQEYDEEAERRRVEADEVWRRILSESDNDEDVKKKKEAEKESEETPKLHVVGLRHQPRGDRCIHHLRSGYAHQWWMQRKLWKQRKKPVSKKLLRLRKRLSNLRSLLKQMWNKM
ncbi:hypothetical protein Bca52824_011373 [Brassica carinata]|uniref:Uncharacterized protein n=1 Tax=Brassica carinata TaxID=52824 RepID=A0A8X8BB28_BRACI|nr:hypothetical protein Bca52824_011373 [Brassica carinata]